MTEKLATGTSMFFIGVSIGLILDRICDSFVELYGSNRFIQALIGIIQIMLIYAIQSFFQYTVHTTGMFMTGFLIVQELYILRLIPTKKNRIEKNSKRK